MTETMTKKLSIDYHGKEKSVVINHPKPTPEMLDSIKTHMNAISDAFRSESLPEMMAHVFILSKTDRPMNGWSINNRLNIMYASLYYGAPATDVRGYSDFGSNWGAVGRKVFDENFDNPKFWILVPIFKYYPKKDKYGNKIPKKDEDGNVIKGKYEVSKYISYFRATPVWDISETYGDPLDEDPELINWTKGLPLMDVANALGIRLTLYNGNGSSALGWSMVNERHIGLGVQSVSTWLHELIHEIEQFTGVITEGGQDPVAEVVAEFGAATLARIFGEKYDIRFTHDYIERYAQQAEKDIDGILGWANKRIMNAVALLLVMAEEVKNGKPLDESAMRRLALSMKDKK